MIWNQIILYQMKHQFAYESKLFAFM